MRARAAADLCGGDKADRKARRARQRSHVTEALFALIWDAARPTGDLEEAEFRITEMRDQLDELYGDEEDRVEDRPVGSVIAGLACGLRLSEQWHRRATDWSDLPFPPPPTSTPAGLRERRRARLRELMQHTIDGIIVGQAALQAGLEARLKEPDVEALIDAEPPMRAARRLCASLGIDFDAVGPMHVFHTPLPPAGGGVEDGSRRGVARISAAPVVTLDSVPSAPNPSPLPLPQGEREDRRDGSAQRRYSEKVSLAGEATGSGQREDEMCESGSPWEEVSERCTLFSLSLGERAGSVA